MRVLLIEDEVRLGENIAQALREGPGFAVDHVQDGETACDVARNQCYDLIILDLNLPQLDGNAVLKRLRARGDKTPVLVLTARAEPESIVTLLNAGADDYVSKPFDLGELIARAKVQIRRGKGVAVSSVRLGELTVNTVEQTVFMAGIEVPVSPLEYRILEYLVHHPRLIVSKRELVEHMYDYNWEHHSNVVEAHLSNLRRKLDSNATGPTIETLRGRGYRLLVGRETLP